MGASTRPNSKQPLERTVIELRYGLNVLEPSYMDDAKKYDIRHIHNSGTAINVEKYLK